MVTASLPFTVGNLEQQLAYGLFSGTGYALVAVGFGLIITVTGRFHIAYGAMYALTAFMAGQVGIPGGCRSGCVAVRRARLRGDRGADRAPGLLAAQPPARRGGLDDDLHRLARALDGREERIALLWIDSGERQLPGFTVKSVALLRRLHHQPGADRLRHRLGGAAGGGSGHPLDQARADDPRGPGQPATQPGHGHQPEGGLPGGLRARHRPRGGRRGVHRRAVDGHLRHGLDPDPVRDHRGLHRRRRRAAGGRRRRGHRGLLQSLSIFFVQPEWSQVVVFSGLLVYVLVKVVRANLGTRNSTSSPPRRPVRPQPSGRGNGR